MRNLTIYRKSAMAGKLAKMNVFVEDPNSNELVLLDRHYKKLGDLKNGEAKTFQVTEDAAKVIVVSEREGRNARWGFYMLDQGNEDVALSGKTTLEKGGQFVFEFDTESGPINTQKINKRRVIKRWFVRILIMVLCVLGLRSCKPEPKTFTVENLNITLTTDFEKEDTEDALMKFDSKKVSVYVNKVMHIFDKDLRVLSAEEYAKFAADNVGVNADITKKANGWVKYDYKKDLGTINASHHFVYFYKTPSVFWIVEFVTPNRYADNCGDDIEQWANSMVFNEQ